MASFDIAVKNAGESPQNVKLQLTGEETLQELIDRIDQMTQVDGHAVVALALGLEPQDQDGRKLSQFSVPKAPVHINKVCVDLHFETESERHWFPSHAKWSRVHQWGCKKFSVAHDACAHLELHAGSPTGAPINERQEIGESGECLVVWLVKPGPEPNGCAI